MRWLLILSIPFMTGCSHIAYYSQSVGGQFEIISRAEPIDDVLNSDSPETLKQQLRLVQRLVRFAEQYYHLNNDGSYLEYADVERPYVLWNVFATPSLSLTPKQWCHPIIGCLSYRGYFAKADALALAQALEADDYDVFVGGVTAYSTLGWFKDPVLNTMLDRGEDYLARVIFHELAHQKLYIPDDTEFNEAFADAVADIALRQWLLENQQGETSRLALLNQERETMFVELILRYREKLQTLFNSKVNDEIKRREKHALFDAMQDDYLAMRSDWHEGDNYDGWFAQPVNNARIAAVSTYRALVADFLALYERQNSDIDKFFISVEALGKCSKKQRHIKLKTRSPDISC